MAAKSATLLISVFSLISAVHFVAAADHIVGGHLGWNPNINYSSWSDNQTFVVNDLISFRYMKNQFNVFEVNKTGYENCTMDGLSGNWSSGKDFILLDKPKTYYFICGNGYCQSGMKVSVTVHKLPSNSSSSESESSSILSHSGIKSDGGVGGGVRGGEGLVLGLFSALIFGIGSGWI